MIDKILFLTFYLTRVYKDKKSAYISLMNDANKSFN